MPSIKKRNTRGCKQCPLLETCPSEKPDSRFGGFFPRAFNDHYFCRHFRCSAGELEAAKQVRRLLEASPEKAREILVKGRAGDKEKHLIRVATADKSGYIDLEGYFYTWLDGKLKHTGQKVHDTLIKRLERIKTKFGVE